jgi:pimeloyl-ACP methyl ester carboxylesterase
MHTTLRERQIRRSVRRALGIGAVAALLAATGATAASASTASSSSASSSSSVKPTIVLEHGAWANGSSWDAVALILRAQGYKVDIAPNSLRGLSLDTAELRNHLAGIKGPLVLVGHSYGGAVISNAATGNQNVKALVFDDAYIPAEGETVASLSGPDSALAAASANPTSVFRLETYEGAPAGIYDTYLLPAVVATAFAPDLPKPIQNYLAKTQPATSLLALGEPSGAPAWTTVPSWDVVGQQDKIIPVAAQLAMAKRAGSQVTQINSSHVSLLSHPIEVASVIAKAVRATS